MKYFLPAFGMFSSTKTSPCASYSRRLCKPLFKHSFDKGPNTPHSLSFIKILMDRISIGPCHTFPETIDDSIADPDNQYSARHSREMQFSIVDCIAITHRTTNSRKQYICNTHRASMLSKRHSIGFAPQYISVGVL
jgi:hypothetical protein